MTDQLTTITEIVDLPISRLRDNPLNVRDEHPDDEERLKRLTGEVETYGVVQPLIVFPDDVADGEFLLADGHRRLAAARLAKLASVPAIVKPTAKEAAELVEIMLTTGRNHAPLSNAEEAKGFQTLLDLGYSEHKIAKRFGQPRKHVRVKAHMRTIEDPVTSAYNSGQMDIDDALALRQLEEQEPEAYQAAAREFERAPHWARHVGVEEVIAQARRKASIERLRADLEAQGAKKAPDEAGWSPKWQGLRSSGANGLTPADVEHFDTFSVAEHIEAGHQFLIHAPYAQDPFVSWFRKRPKEQPPELSEEELAEQKKLAELKDRLQGSSVTRRKFLANAINGKQLKLLSPELAAQFLWGEISPQILDMGQFWLEEISGVPFPREEDIQDEEGRVSGARLFTAEQEWEQKVIGKLSGLPLTKMVLLFWLANRQLRESALLAPEGFDTPGAVEFMEELQSLGYELTPAESETAAFWQQQREGAGNEVENDD